MATRFRFRLEGLLKLRKSLEEEAQRHLGRMTRLRQEAEAALEDLQDSHARTVSARAVPRGQVIDLEQWRQLERYLVVLEHRIAAATEALRLASVRVLEAHQALTKAHRAHLMLVRLKERRKDQHDLEVQLEEYRLVDEMAVLRHRFRPQAPQKEARP